MRRLLPLFLPLLVAAGARPKPTTPCADRDACSSACDARAPGACTRLGDFARTGADGQPTEQSLAPDAWKRGCDQKDGRACVRLARYLVDAVDDGAAARKALEAGCAAHEGKACFDLAALLAGAGAGKKQVRAAEEKGKKLLLAQCQRGDAEPCATLGRLYQDGGSVKKSEKQAAAYRERAARLREEACRAGDDLACWWHFDDDPARARPLVQERCDAGRKGLCPLTAR